MKKQLIIYAINILMLLLHMSAGYCAADTAKRVPEPDKALLSQFELLCKKMEDVKGDYTLGGVINIIDKVNPADRMDHVGFLFCKQGDEFYYKLGNTVTLNEQGVYLYIDYLARRIMLSAKKEVIYDMGLKQFADIGATVRSENYTMTSKITGEEQTISLINEHHISCKEYALTFDKRDMKIRRLYMRLTNLDDPLNKAKEKVIDVSITRWDDSADLSRYISKSEVIRPENGGWRTAIGFKGYELIKM